MFYLGVYYILFSNVNPPNNKKRFYFLFYHFDMGALE
jgi:hypothetical protein